MNTREGVRRIVVAGRLITLAGITLIIVKLFYPMVGYLFSGTPCEVAALGLLIWLGGWCWQGFNSADVDR